VKWSERILDQPELQKTNTEFYTLIRIPVLVAAVDVVSNDKRPGQFFYFFAALWQSGPFQLYRQFGKYLARGRAKVRS